MCFHSNNVPILLPPKANTFLALFTRSKAVSGLTKLPKRPTCPQFGILHCLFMPLCHPGTFHHLAGYGFKDCVVGFHNKILPAVINVKHTAQSFLFLISLGTKCLCYCFYCIIYLLFFSLAASDECCTDLHFHYQS